MNDQIDNLKVTKPEKNDQKLVIGERMTIKGIHLSSEYEDNEYRARVQYNGSPVFVRYKGDRHTAAHLGAYTKVADRMTVTGVIGEELIPVKPRKNPWRQMTITIEGTDDVRVFGRHDFSHIKPYASEVYKRQKKEEERRKEKENDF
jgi:hypothetical protein